ncbi:transcriptional regulator, TetR family [Aquimarina amphilecti]|uniref:Transcriptional regulator, TetR family n=1 Tax=Aquimarina amphilecti TaxID=1038014 RepID=A0A1H7RR15_AQUAM|nr:MULTISPECIES: TetR/AcrR family transcriptional regulator [Aquimarina]MBQ4802880.1 TetR/AcrR family transcriptional regulator [Aquimarina sp. MMG015]SEL62459.1 transcriptional regulator, TetR family [Aquimarina amphilecti]
MRPVKVEDKQLMDGLNKVFRAKGYEGASLNELAEGAGLKKASLYHRFPEGKKGIGLAVLSYSSDWLHKNLYELLIDKKLTKEKRLEMTLTRIKDLYDDGKETCVLRSLSMESGMGIFGEQIKGEMNRWIRNFTEFGLEFGLSKDQSTRIAKQGLISIQGSLVVSNAMSDNSLFLDTLEDIKLKYKV